ncbi:MAG: DUF6858 family protein [Sulfurimonas sp.]|jgi:hypothetical protein|nr:hypothetical protein [Sulfurimonadaceae bacterium]
MTKSNFLDKFPVLSLEVAKNSTKYSSTDEIVEFFKSKIESHPVATFIATFDHFSHTKNLGGDMVSGLVNAKNVVFCFGQAIPATKILAVRPRSIGVSEFADKFVIDFMEAPKEDLTLVMQNWAKELII